MDIKLRARLSAYTKIESLSGLQSNVPSPDATAAGNVLGVNDIGKYTLFPSAGREEIDTLFTDIVGPEVVTKDNINDLFVKETQPESVTKEDINTLFETKEEIEAVDKNSIDSLFETTEDIDTVEKEEIDTLFASEDSKPAGTVSFRQIDSLFN